MAARERVTHRTQRGVWGDEVSPKIPFSGRGAGVAHAAPGKERFSACLQQANRPAFRLGRPVSYIRTGVQKVVCYHLDNIPSGRYSYFKRKNGLLQSHVIPKRSEESQGFPLNLP